MLSRRALLLTAPAASALVLGAPAAAQAKSKGKGHHHHHKGKGNHRHNQSPVPKPTPTTNKPKFGFIGGQLSPTWTKQDAKNELTAMSKAGSQVARITFNAEVLLSSWGDIGKPVTGNAQGVKDLHEVLDHAKSLGMDLWLNMNYGYHDQSASYADWLQKSRAWWEFAAKNFASKVTVLQVFNEATRWHYRFYKQPDNQAQYLIELRDLIKVCGDIFKRYNPNVKVTHNAGGYPVSDRLQIEEWIPDFDVIAPSLDMIAVDPYFSEALQGGELEKIDSRLATLESRYKKPVAISETGMSTHLDKLREDQQVFYYKRCIEVLKNCRAKYVIFYSFRDTGDATLNMSQHDLSESTFGVMRRDGSLKPAGEYLYSNPLPR